ncbi:MAG TPA: lactonase family protein [Blastocatellia bacterium]|nr:lactonase family protein [Blastocatellia bacterium]
MLYIGTYTNGRNESIYVYRLNLASGELQPVTIGRGVVNPSYLAIDAQNRYLYAVNEVDQIGGKPNGGVTALAIDQQTGELRVINQQSSQGRAPCYINIDPSGKYVLVANYNSGSFAVLPINSDGSLGAAVDFVQDSGSGPNRGRQEGPHGHCILTDPLGSYAFAVDLGIDKVMIYNFNQGSGKLTPNTQPFFQAQPGAGPRHFEIHPNRQFAYVINELNSTLTAFNYDNARGLLSELQTVPTLPAGFTGTNTSADIHVHPSGKFIYGSNRGHDSIVAYTIDAATGRLTFLAHESTQGRTPRNFVIDPTGTYLLVANQDTNTVVTFRIDQTTGRLISTGKVTSVPTPVCLKFAPSV